MRNQKSFLLTENVDMAEFDDDFFAAQDKIKNSRGMSVEKLEECKNLRNGLIYFSICTFEDERFSLKWD